jgi:phospholipid/cholesterol/gamma-HCH transport system permease protein
VLTVASDLVGGFGGWFVTVHMYGVEHHLYWEYASKSVDIYSINVGLVKSIFFGATISSVGCFFGFNCGNGAQGVGRACTESFVVSFVSILVMNFFLALAMNNLYNALWPGSESILA